MKPSLCALMRSFVDLFFSASPVSSTSPRRQVLPFPFHLFINISRTVVLGLAILAPLNAHAGACVWYGDADGIHRISTDNNAVVANVSIAKEPRALAMTAYDCGVWLLAHNHLQRYDANGALSQDIDIQLFNPKAGTADYIAVDADDGSLWVTSSKTLFHVTSAGVLLGAYATPGPLGAIAVALDRNIWALGNKQLYQFSPAGALLSTRNLQSVVNDQPKSIQVDNLGKLIWLIGGQQVIGVGTGTNQAVVAINLPAEVSAAALAPLTGTIWIATKQTLFAYGREGNLIQSIDLRPLGLDKAGALAFDPAAQSLWLGSQQAVGRFSLDGVLLATLPARDGDNALGVPPFVINPTLSIVAPPSNALTNNPKPSLVLAYGADCYGQPCGLAKSYFGDYRLSAQLNNLSIGAGFVYDAVTGQASYAPASRLPEGQNRLTAQATDSFGRLSNAIDNRFTVDTVAPQFLTLTPADGSVSSTSSVTLRGSVDDVKASVVLHGAGAAQNTTVANGVLNFAFPVTLASGLNNFTLSAVDPAGNTSVRTERLTYIPLVVAITSPAPGTSVNTASIAVSGTFQGPPGTVVTANGVNASISGSGYSASVPLALGTNAIAVVARAPDGGSVTQSVSVTRISAPTLSVTSPVTGASVTTASITVSGTFDALAGAVVTVNGVNAVISGASYSASVPLALGANAIAVTVRAPDGGSATQSVNIFRISVPTLTVTSPASGASVNTDSVVVSGAFDALPGATVTVNGINATLSGAGYSANVPLVLGTNQITVTVRAPDGGSATQSISVTRASFTPTLVVTGPVSGAIVNIASVTVSGTFEGPSGTVVTVNGANASISGSSFSASVALVSGSNAIAVVVRVPDGGTATQNITVTYIAGGTTPPDPVVNPTPIDRTVITTVANSTAFLYSGANPVQTGVVSGVIETKRAAVLRGKVLTRDGQALPGVTITVLGHPELGQTVSRANGMFDMAANGGGFLTVNYEKAGYLPVQRTVKAPWQDYVMASDVVMTSLDGQGTTIDLAAAAPIQAARGSVVVDEDGTRQATLVFAQGTTATMVLPNGTTQPLTSLTVRATEYTVGPNGLKAMPGQLPPASGYTYAVENSVDQAIAAGAISVQFSQPVYQYVDNFLNFPVGGVVPSGYYDRQRAAWVPSSNGRVIKVLSTVGGIATLDTDGDGQADDAAHLAALNITDSERTQLATLYAAGASLWRVPLTHFTPQDYNWPVAAPPGSEPPTVPDPDNEAPEPKPDGDCGSIIECQNQSLGESVALTGSPFSLNYKSNRMPGRDSLSTFINLSGATLPPGIKRIELEVNVAGRQFTQSFPATLNQTYNFVWDGLDAFGRKLQGAQRATIRVGYVYGLTYISPTGLLQSFGKYGTGALATSRALGESILWKTSETTMGRWDALAAGLAGWTLSPHHAYDPVAQTLYLGDGRTRNAKTLSQVISTVAGNGVLGFFGDGGQATKAGLSQPIGVTVDAAGNLFIADLSNDRIRKVTPDGIITTVAGNGGRGYSGDGGPATSAMLQNPKALAVDSQGTLYIMDGSFRLRKVSPTGIITTVAGTGQPGISGDGGPATNATLNSVNAIAVDPQGNVYLADAGARRIRKIGTDGIIDSIAGNGNLLPLGDGGPAVSAAIPGQTSMAIDSQGNIYLSIFSDCRVRKITTSGIITTVAGTGACQFAGDGGPATAAGVGAPWSVAVDSRDNLYISDVNFYRIRRVTPDGIITTIAGTGRGATGDGGLATAATFDAPYSIAFDAKDNLYVADLNNNRVRKITPYFPQIPIGDFLIASDDGSQLYHFNAAGRHLRTLSANTGAVVHSFTYGAQGFVTQITDGDGNVTNVERDVDGKPTAIVAPDGQRTVLTLDSNGYIASIANPASETTRMTYSDSGLLSTFTNPRNFTSTITYDAAGRLIKDQNAAGGYWNLARSGTATNYEVDKTSALGRQTRYQVEKLAIGDMRFTNTLPDGSVEIKLKKSDGTTEITAADGTITTSIDAPDPRFGVQAPFAKSTIIKTPSGLTSTMTATRQATLSSPSDLLSLLSQTDVVTINGKAFTTVYNASQLQYMATTPLNRTTILKVDAQGRPISEQVTGVLPTSYTYDARGRLTLISQGSGAAVRTMSYSYNPQGFVDSITDAQNRVARYSYDAAGRVKTIILPDNRMVAFNYDANGNVTSVTPPSRPAHGFAYSAVDVATDYIPPALGGQPVATHFDYNVDKQPTKVTRPDGLTIDFGYDSAGRLATMTTPTGAISYGYEPSTGRVASITAPGGIGLAYSYDGAMITKSTMTGPVTGNVSKAYDNFFRISQIGVNGSNVTFSYDNDGLLIGAGNLTLARDAGNGFITGGTLGQITTSQGYDGFGQLASFTAKQGANVLYDEQYVRDKLGRITQKTVSISGQSNVYGYSYDANGRLTDVTKDGAPSGHFEYDANGNRTLAYGIAAAYDDQDRLTDYGSAQYSYTANGELKQITAGANVTVYNYDVFGNLTHADLPDGTKLDYLADGSNRRVGKKVNGTLTQGFLYQDQVKPVAELDGQGNVASQFVYGGKLNVPEYMIKGGVSYRIVTDQIGSVRLVVNSATGVVAQRMDYDEWGNVQQDTNPGFQPFGFAGGLYDRDTGLVRFGARDYDPRTARWTTKDPIGFKGGDMGLYTYAEGSPVSRIDPTGNLSIIEVGGVLFIMYEVYENGKDWYDRAKGMMEKGEARDRVIERYKQSTANNSPGGKFCPPPGGKITDTNPATGNPYIIDQQKQYESDVAANLKDSMIIADPSAVLPGGAYENGKTLGKLAR